MKGGKQEEKAISCCSIGSLIQILASKFFVLNKYTKIESTLSNIYVFSVDYSIYVLPIDS